MKAVETTSEPPIVSITVEKHPDQASLQNAVLKAGDFTITEQSVICTPIQDIDKIEFLGFHLTLITNITFRFYT